MSANEPRPLPPRALPSLNLQNGDGTQVQPISTPRKKTQHASAGRLSSGRAKRPTTAKKRPISPRNHDPPSDVVSLQPSAAASEANESRVSENSTTPNQRRTKRTRKRKPATANEETQPELESRNTISSFINEEDVVNVDKIDDAVVMANLPCVPAGSGGSAVHDKVYVQTTNGFAAHSKDWIDQRNKAASNEARLTYGDERVKPSDIAKQNEKGFMLVTLILHGALAGLAIWQVVISYSLYSMGVINFLTQYQSLAMPTQTVYYIILVLCTVSALDRYDFAGKNKHIIQSIAKFDLAGVAVFVYYVSILFSIGLAGLDAWIASGVSLPPSETTTTTAPQSSTLAPLSPDLTGANLDPGSTVNTWLILIVFRTVFASLGWLIIAFDPLRNDMTWE